MVHEKPIAKKAHKLVWFLVKANKISENFYKIKKFLRTSWPSVITHNDLPDLIICM